MLAGQAHASHSQCPLKRVWLVAPEGCRPYGEALDAIRRADIILLGPGSLFTSVIPNLLVPGVVEAIRESSALCVFVCNVSDMDGETLGMRADEHVVALLEHGMAGLLDYVVAHAPGAPQPEAAVRAYLESLPEGAVKPVGISSEGIERIHRMGVRLAVRNLSNELRPEWHDPKALRDVLKEIFGQCLSRPM
jgi:uncharacterized cofD-like protein